MLMKNDNLVDFSVTVIKFKEIENVIIKIFKKVELKLPVWGVLRSRKAFN